ncbi:MAG: hypothetical protein AB7E55_21745 [Pigmentiphaga sp.]
MKVAIGHRLQEGPYGGGNAFVRNLVAALRADGHTVAFSLEDPDLDFILITDPRRRSPNVAFSPGAVLRYVARHPRTLVVHRINECDERKNTRGMNFLLRTANYCADHTVFVGSWLQNLAVTSPRPNPSWSTILNGADPAIFHSRGYRGWDGIEPLRLVTHHWGGNWNKGFDVYSRLDAMLAEPEWRGRIAFTYIGNLPPGFRFRHADYIPPLAGEQLAEALRRHHVYVTASINEPGGNHQIEGGLCGLPLIYRDSGCMPEYCEGFGIMFGEKGFENALERMMREYPDHLAHMKEFPHTAERTTAAWIALFRELDRCRDTYISRRKHRASLIRPMLAHLL